MDRYHGELEVEGGRRFVVDIEAPLNVSGWRSRPIEGVHLQPGMAAAGPFRVWLHAPHDAHNAWHGRATWSSPDDGETWCLVSEGPLSAP